MVTVRILSDIIAGHHVARVFNALKNDGLIGSSVYMDAEKYHTWNPRKARYGTEFQMGSIDSKTETPVTLSKAAEYGYTFSDKAVKKAGRRHVRNSGAYGADSGNALRYSATWHEWGLLIAALFVIDPNAKVGFYKDAEHFAYETNGWERDRHYLDWHQQEDGRVFDFLGFVEDEIENLKI